VGIVVVKRVNIDEREPWLTSGSESETHYPGNLDAPRGNGHA